MLLSDDTNCNSGPPLCHDGFVTEKSQGVAQGLALFTAAPFRLRLRLHLHLHLPLLPPRAGIGVEL
jgi:hypothetical protein